MPPPSPSSPFAHASLHALFASGRSRQPWRASTLVLASALIVSTWGCESTVPINDDGCETLEDCDQDFRCDRGKCTNEPATSLPTPDVVFDPEVFEPAVDPEVKEPEPAAPGPSTEPGAASPEPGAASPEPAAPAAEPSANPSTPEPTPSPTPNPSPTPASPEPDPPCDDQNVDEVCADTQYCVNGDCFNLPFCPGGSCPTGLFCHSSTGRCDRDPCVGAECGSCTVSSCSDNLFCNGSETCDGVNCSPGTAPCGTGPCDENIDRCVECVNNGDCTVTNETCNNNFCTCEAQCNGRNCGADGCGGSCGTCNASQTCNASGTCINSGDVCDVFVDNTPVSGFADINGSLDDPADSLYTWGAGVVANRERLLDDFVLQTRATESFEITLSAAHDSYLYLYDVTGGACTEVAFNDDLATGNINSQITFTPGTGSYRVVATTYNSNTEGSYSIVARQTLCGKPVANANAYTQCLNAINASGANACDSNLCVDFGNSREFCCLTNSTFCTDTFGTEVGVAGADFAGSCGTP